MIAYRIVKRRYANLSGEGARIAGGRWNSPGLPALYLADHVALAVCENLVHMDKRHLPANRVLLSVDVPDEAIQTEYAEFDFADDTIEVGDKWLSELSSLCIKVQSRVGPHCFNYMVNTLHQQFSMIRLVAVEDFDFDRRFFLGP